MAQRPWFTANIHSPGTGVALVLIGLSLLPVGLLAAVQLSCVARPTRFVKSRPMLDPAFSVDRINRCMGGRDY